MANITICFSEKTRVYGTDKYGFKKTAPDIKDKYLGRYSSNPYDSDTWDATVYPTLPGTSIRDYSRPGAKIKDNEVYPTLPGTSIRDYSKPGYRINPE